MNTAIGNIWVWLPYLIGASMGILGHRLWTQFRQASANTSLPTHWMVSAKQVHNSRDRLYYSLLRHSFPSLQVMMKVGLLQFLVPEANNKQASAVRRSLSEASVSFVLCTKEGRVVAVIDLLESKQLTAPFSAIKRAALSRAHIRYIELPSEPLVNQETLQMLVQSDQFEGGITSADFSEIISSSLPNDFGSSQGNFSSTREQLAKTVESKRQALQHARRV